MAEASQDALDLPQLADELQRSVDGVREQLAQLEGWGLLLTERKDASPCFSTPRRAGTSAHEASSTTQS